MVIENKQFIINDFTKIILFFNNIQKQLIKIHIRLHLLELKEHCQISLNFPKHSNVKTVHFTIQSIDAQFGDKRNRKEFIFHLVIIKYSFILIKMKNKKMMAA